MASGRSLRVLHLYPELLNLYGDSGNVLVLRRRLEWRGIACDVREVHMGERASLADVDLAFIGGGTEREQCIVCDELRVQQPELAAFVEDGGVLLAVCGGYQLLGHSYLMGDKEVHGLSLVDLYTDRGSPRLIGNVVVESRIARQRTEDDHAQRRSFYNSPTIITQGFAKSKCKMGIFITLLPSFRWLRN